MQSLAFHYYVKQSQHVARLSICCGNFALTLDTHDKSHTLTSNISGMTLMKFEGMFIAKARRGRNKCTLRINGEHRSINYNSVTLTPAKVRLSLHLKYTHEHSHACTWTRDRGVRLQSCYSAAPVPT